MAEDKGPDKATEEPATANCNRVVLGRNEIFAARGKLKIQKEYIPELGGWVCVREMTGMQRDELEDLITEGGKKSKRNLRSRIAIMSLSDEKGELLFRLDDIGKLGELSGTALDRVFAVATRISRLSPQALEELMGNSSDGQSGDSTSS